MGWCGMTEEKTLGMLIDGGNRTAKLPFLAKLTQLCLSSNDVFLDLGCAGLLNSEVLEGAGQFGETEPIKDSGKDV